jgi:Common central domain of tyrosinase
VYVRRAFAAVEAFMKLLGSLLTFVLALAWGIASSGAQERVRKSIDALTADELETYIFALKKVRDKSLTDPFVEYSYAHLAGIHNFPLLFNGACMHWRYEFLAWHRAHLINYEDALRAADPPRTANVTIPYWDWSRKPTGQRFPVAFENNAVAVAAHYGRPIDPALLAVLANPRRKTAASSPIFPWLEIAEIAKVSTGDFFGPANDHGAIENPPHDSMHNFIGGDLLSTGTAADDVIFWSFHSFIDLVWWWRQQTITDTVPCTTCMLNGMPTKTALGSPGPTQVKDTVNAKEQLNYTYQFTPDVAPPAPPVVAAAVGARTFSRRFPVLADLALAPPAVVREFRVGYPPGAAEKLTVAVERAAVPADLAYQAFVYVHPASQAFDAASVDFRDRYLVGHFAQFANPHLSHGSHQADREFRVPLDLATYPAVRSATGEPLVVSVAIHVSRAATDPLPAREAVSQPALERNTKIGSATLRVP